MKKLFTVIFCIMLASIMVFHGAENEKKTRLAVLDFTAKMVSQDLADAVSENVVTKLIDTGIFEVIERSQLQKLVEEMSLQSSDEFNDSLRVEIGNLYGAELAIVGSVTRFGDAITINVRAVDIKTGINKFAKDFTTKKEEDIPDEIQKMVNTVFNIYSDNDVSSTKLDENSNYSNRESSEQVSINLDGQIRKRKRNIAGTVVFGSLFAVTAVTSIGMLLYISFVSLDYIDFQDYLDNASDEDVGIFAVGLLSGVVSFGVLVPAVISLALSIYRTYRIKQYRNSLSLYKPVRLTPLATIGMDGRVGMGLSIRI
jgi:TolB-like protein